MGREGGHGRYVQEPVRTYMRLMFTSPNNAEYLLNPYARGAS